MHEILLGTWPTVFNITRLDFYVKFLYFNCLRNDENWINILLVWFITYGIEFYNVLLNLKLSLSH